MANVIQYGDGWLVGWLEFNISFQHKYGYIRDEQYGDGAANTNEENSSTLSLT